jgi:hypothetical protein
MEMVIAVTSVPEGQDFKEVIAASTGRYSNEIDVMICLLFRELIINLKYTSKLEL